MSDLNQEDPFDDDGFNDITEDEIAEPESKRESRGGLVKGIFALVVLGGIGAGGFYAYQSGMLASVLPMGGQTADTAVMPPSQDTAAVPDMGMPAPLADAAPTFDPNMPQPLGDMPPVPIADASQSGMQPVLDPATGLPMDDGMQMQDMNAAPDMMATDTTGMDMMNDPMQAMPGALPGGMAEMPADMANVTDGANTGFDPGALTPIDQMADAPVDPMMDNGMAADAGQMPSIPTPDMMAMDALSGDAAATRAPDMQGAEGFAPVAAADDTGMPMQDPAIDMMAATQVPAAETPVSAPAPVASAPVTTQANAPAAADPATTAALAEVQAELARLRQDVATKDAAMKEMETALRTAQRDARDAKRAAETAERRQAAAPVATSEPAPARQTAAARESTASAPTKNAAATKTYARSMSEGKVNWTLAAAKPGVAWLDGPAKGDLTEVRVGEYLKGYGQIAAIRMDDNGVWVVETQKGTIRQTVTQ